MTRHQKKAVLASSALTKRWANREICFRRFPLPTLLRRPKQRGKNHDACADSYQSQTVKKERKKPETRLSNFFGDVFWAKMKDQNILYNPTYRFSVLSLNTNSIKQSVLKTPSKQGNFRHKHNFNKSLRQDVPNNALRTLVLYSLL